MRRKESPPDSLQQATATVRAEYERRSARPTAHLGTALLATRLRAYGEMFNKLGVLPFEGRRILDVGCGNGKWLHVCCERWGGRPENCVGVDLRGALMAAWRSENPTSPITLVCEPAHELDYPDASFDVIHQSMMFSSVTSAPLREAIAANMWRMLKPGGCLASYDFWINPVNRHTVGITTAELGRLFPSARLCHMETITLAPPITRALRRISDRLVLGLERLRFLNTHVLAAFVKPAVGTFASA